MNLIILRNSDVPQLRAFLTRSTPELYSLPSNKRKMLGEEHQERWKDPLTYGVESKDPSVGSGYCLLLLLALGQPAGPAVSTLNPLENTVTARAKGGSDT